MSYDAWTTLLMCTDNDLQAEVIRRNRIKKEMADKEQEKFREALTIFLQTYPSFSGYRVTATCESYDGLDFSKECEVRKLLIQLVKS